MISPQFETAGYAVTSSLLTLEERTEVVARLHGDRRVGARNLLQSAWCATLAHDLARHPALADLMPSAAVAVQCTLFEKSPARNWLVTLHQDLSIPVASRVNSSALQGWSHKEGVLYVQPPPSVLGKLVAVRLQLDDCEAADGALRVVAGSHRYGRLEDDTAFALRDRTGETDCPVVRGAALVMRPLLLHASSKLSASGTRRVLHFLFGPRHLPLGLAWAFAI